MAGLAINITSENEEADLNAVGNEEAGKFVYFDIKGLTEHVATYSVDNSTKDKYYIAWDENDYMFIVNLTDKEYAEMKNIVDYTYGKTDVEPKAYRITGTNVETPKELQKIVMEVYGDISADSDINSYNYSNYFGECYIDTQKTPNTTESALYIIGAIAFLGYGMIALIVVIVYDVKSKKTIKRLESSEEIGNVCDELSREENQKQDNKQRVILTDNYIIDYANYLTVLKYTDIVWLYEYTYRYNGFENVRHIKAMDRNKKMNVIVSKKTLGKNYDLFKDTFNKILVKCPNALVGYTSENIKATKKANFDETVRTIDKLNMDK